MKYNNVKKILGAFSGYTHFNKEKNWTILEIGMFLFTFWIIEPFSFLNSLKFYLPYFIYVEFLDDKNTSWIFICTFFYIIFFRSYTSPQISSEDSRTKINPVHSMGACQYSSCIIQKISLCPFSPQVIFLHVKTEFDKNFSKWS